MTGKAYYLTTLGAWRRHAGRLANSHWVALGAVPKAGASEDAAIVPIPAIVDAGTADPAVRDTTVNDAPADDRFCVLSETTPVLVLIEADEGAHLALQDDPEFEQLPHPLAQRSISEEAQAALATHGVGAGATMFEAAEMVARVHPLLRHRVF